MSEEKQNSSHLDETENNELLEGLLKLCCSKYLYCILIKRSGKRLSDSVCRKRIHGERFIIPMFMNIVLCKGTSEPCLLSFAHHLPFSCWSSSGTDSTWSESSRLISISCRVSIHIHGLLMRGWPYSILSLSSSSAAHINWAKLIVLSSNSNWLDNNAN